MTSSTLPACLLFYRGLYRLYREMEEKGAARYVWLRNVSNGKMLFRGAVLVTTGTISTAFALGLPMHREDTFTACISAIQVPQGTHDVSAYVSGQLAQTMDHTMIYGISGNSFYFPETPHGALAWRHAPPQIGERSYELQATTLGDGYPTDLVEHFPGLLRGALQDLA